MVMWLAFAAALGVSAGITWAFWRLRASTVECVIVSTTLGWAAANGILGELRYALVVVCLGGLALAGYYLGKGSRWS